MLDLVIVKLNSFVVCFNIVCVAELFWMAPEFLRAPSSMPTNGTREGDVYAFSIIVQELVLGTPYSVEFDNGTDSERMYSDYSTWSSADVHECIYTVKVRPC